MLRLNDEPLERKRAAERPLEKKEWNIPPGTDARLIFSVYENQFKRGMINIDGGYGLKYTEEGGWTKVSLANQPEGTEEIICHFQKSTRDGIRVVFNHFHYANWFDDGLSY